LAESRLGPGGKIEVFHKIFGNICSVSGHIDGISALHSKMKTAKRNTICCYNIAVDMHVLLHFEQPFSLFPKMKVGLSNYQSVCVCLCVSH
jgi:hypothetical protein